MGVIGAGVARSVLVVYSLCIATGLSNGSSEWRRRGLAVQDSWIAYLETSEENCDRISAAVQSTHSRHLLGNQASELKEVVIRRSCSIMIKGVEDDVMDSIERVKDLLRDQVPDVDHIAVEADLWMRAADSVRSYGLDRIDQEKLPLDNSFSPEFSGKGVNIFILDSGVRVTHVDFESRASLGPNVMGDGSDGTDIDGHGTHCAGVAASRTYGVAKNASIVSIRVLDNAGFGTSSWIIEAIRYAVENEKLNGQQAGLISMSIGGAKSASLDLAAREAALSMIVVVAAGNDAEDACLSSPSSEGGSAVEKGLLTVGSIDQLDTMSDFSNFGTCVDIFAPGTDILSTFATSDTSTMVLSGTSMACPHVSGAAAIYLEKNGYNHTTAIKDLMENASVGQVLGLGITQSPNKIVRVPQKPISNETNAPTVPALIVTASPTTSPTTSTPTVGVWTCNSSWRGANDGCDCGCGARDSDCDDPSAFLYCHGSEQNVKHYCSPVTHVCEVPTTPSPTVSPQANTWTCPLEWLNAGDGCDCECGGFDSDCLAEGVEVFCNGVPSSFSTCDFTTFKCVYFWEVWGNPPEDGDGNVTGASHTDKENERQEVRLSPSSSLAIAVGFSSFFGVILIGLVVQAVRHVL